MRKQNLRVQITPGAGGPCITKGADKLTDHSSLPGAAPSLARFAIPIPCTCLPEVRSFPGNEPFYQMPWQTQSRGGEEGAVAGLSRNTRAHMADAVPPPDSTHYQTALTEPALGATASPALLTCSYRILRFDAILEIPSLTIAQRRKPRPRKKVTFPQS